MTLEELINFLEQRESTTPVPLGFGEPMSYRGYYDQLAFPLERDTTVGEMLEHARSALGQTFCGYKGGDFTMREWTDCWLAEYGREGEGIGPVLLAFMLGEAPAAGRD